MERWPLIGRDAERALLGDALAARAGGAGVLIVGPSGVGKTRLVREAVSGLDRRTVVWLSGTAAAQGIPLAAVLAVFPDVTVAPETGIAEARARLAGLRRPVLVVDDAHWLDATTQTLLHLLVTTRQVRALVITAGELPIPPTVSSLWIDGHLTRIDLGPLDPAESARLMEAMVGAPVVAAVSAELHSRSQGLPLALRELVTEATAAGALVVSGGLGHAIAPLPASRRLGEVVAANLEAAGDGGREVLDVVALAEPIPLRMLLRVVGAAQAGEAERAGLIHVSNSRLGRLDRHVVTAGHRVYAETALAALGALRRRQILERLVDAACGQEQDGGEAMALRSAAWCLEIGRPVSVDLVLRATRLTHRALDPDQATHFARQLWRQRPDFDTGLLYATTLARRQRYESSLELLTELHTLAVSDEQRMTRASMANEILARLGRHDEAMRELQQAEQTVGSRRAKAHLVARRAFTANLAGRTRTGLVLIDPLLRSDDPQERREAQAYAVVMLALDGRADEALALAQELEQRSDLARGDDDRLAAPEQLAAVQRGYALVYAGRLTEARQWAERGVRMAEEYGSDFLLALWLNLNARAELERGDAARAILPLGRLIAEVPEVSGGAQRALAYSALVEAHALLGQVRPAREAQAALAEHPGNVPWHPAGSARMASALLAYGEGDGVTAIGLFEEAYRRAAPANAAIALAAAHAVARYGRRQRGLDLALELAREVPPVQGPLAALRLAHLRALAGGDVDGLFGAAEGFAALGADLLAAEAYAVAATRAVKQGDTRRAAGGAVAGRQIAARLDGVRTPDLLLLSSAAAPVLTRRERDVARLAAGGMSSQAIAESLVVSVRTIDNHLQNIYRKLGVHNRQDLRESLEPQRFQASA